jgi:hypothetical protein
VLLGGRYIVDAVLWQEHVRGLRAMGARASASASQRAFDAAVARAQDVCAGAADVLGLGRGWGGVGAGAGAGAGAATDEAHGTCWFLRARLFAAQRRWLAARVCLRRASALLPREGAAARQVAVLEAEVARGREQARRADARVAREVSRWVSRAMETGEKGGTGRDGDGGEEEEEAEEEAAWAPRRSRRGHGGAADSDSDDGGGGPSRPL